MPLTRAPDETFTFALFTWPWNRRFPRRFVLLGKQFGLDVEHEHDGGWTLRYHLLTAVGAGRDVQRLWRAVDRWQRLTRGLPVATREQRRKQREALFASLFKPDTKEEPCL